LISLEKGTGSVWKYIGGNKWARIGTQSGFTRVAVDPHGNPRVAKADGKIFHWNGSRFVNIPGGARNIGVGVDGKLISLEKARGFEWKYLGNKKWTRLDKEEGFTNIAVDPHGNPWVVNKPKQILHWKIK
jgi:hypothetical protein